MWCCYRLTSRKSAGRKGKKKKKCKFLTTYVTHTALVICTINSCRKIRKSFRGSDQVNIRLRLLARVTCEFLLLTVCSHEGIFLVTHKVRRMGYFA